MVLSPRFCDDWTYYKLISEFQIKQQTECCQNYKAKILKKTCWLVFNNKNKNHCTNNLLIICYIVYNEFIFNVIMN